MKIDKIIIRILLNIYLLTFFSTSFFSIVFAVSCDGICNRNPIAESSFFVQINQFESTNGILPANDPDSDPITYTIVKFPVGGTISEISSTGEFTYTTVGNFSGTDYILFKVSDGALLSDIATATIQVDYINRAPTVSNINLTAPQNVPFVFDTGLLGNDLDSDPLIYTIIFTTSHGVLSDFDNTNGNFIYTPETGFIGTDVFTYRANDGIVNSEIATGTINFVLNNKPNLTLLGDNPLLHPAGTIFTDPGATATDTEDGVITSSITTKSDIDSNIPGNYFIAYRAADIFGVSTNATRTVIVFDSSGDIDKDGILNSQDPDVDGDNIVNNLDDDIDGDGLLNSTDTDDDNDGVLDESDTSPNGFDAYDFDKDGILNSQDPDVDGDNIVNNLDDDIDGDGLLNSTDTDDDNDGVLDESDTSPNGFDAYDFDKDKILNEIDFDLDGDGIINFFDTDVDGDGLLNSIDTDDDNDFLLDTSDTSPRGFGTETDFDGDGILNISDTDLDGDNIVNNLDDDIDGDGIENSLDTDDDNDNILDLDDVSPSNFSTEKISDKKETPIATSFGGGGSIVIPTEYINSTSTGIVLGTNINLSSTTNATSTCKNYLDPKTIISPKLKNDKYSVTLLQKFLNLELNLNIPTLGNYGSITQNAVKQFQLKYKEDILKPWGLTEPTVNVYYTTVTKINKIVCPNSDIKIEIEKLIPYSTNN